MIISCCILYFRLLYKLIAVANLKDKEKNWRRIVNSAYSKKSAKKASVGGTHMHRQIFASVFVWILVILISGCSWKIPTNQGKEETAPSDMINAAATDTSAVSDPGTFPDASTSAL